MDRYVQLINMGGDCCGMGLASEFPEEYEDENTTSRASNQEWVNADEAQSRIAELEVDRDKWRNECLAANESERKLFQRQAELEAEVADLKLQLGMCDHSLHAAWNDAMDASYLAAVLWLDDPDDERDAYQLFAALKR